MTVFARLVLVLCICATACSHEDTAPSEKWPRSVEARIAGAEWSACRKIPLPGDRVVADARCEAAVALSRAPCQSDEPTRASAVTMLLAQPHCTDEAVTALENVVSAEPEALSDLAAAYYTRAQRQDRASDLFRAYDAASRAARLNRTPEALFNLALTQEALAFGDAALATWKSLPDEPRWGIEKAGALRRLEGRVGPAIHWERHKALLDAALARDDERTIRQVIDRFPKTAYVYFDRLVRRDPAPRIALFARLLSQRLGGDRYPLEAAAGSRDALTLEQRRVETTVEENGVARRLATLDALEAEARQRRYGYTAALIQSSRGYVHWTAGEQIASLAAHESANRQYAAFADHEGLADSLAFSAGILREMGQIELAARDALRALRAASRGTDFRTRHKAWGESARVALELRLPQVALAIQNHVFANVAGQQSPSLKAHLAIALRTRAEFELAANDLAAADGDLREAARLGEATENEKYVRMLTSRLGEIQGQNLLRTDARAAAAAFTRALDALKPGEYPTFRAKLLVQRAGAYRSLKAGAAEERDLNEALEVLRHEEKLNLQRRRPGEREALWSAYFTRPHDAYRQLIAHLMEQRSEEAFGVAERSRAIEVIDLVRKLPFAPPAFLALTRDGEPIALEDVRRHLPEGTFLLQYSVTDRRVFAWIVSRDAFEPIEIVAERESVQRRCRELQKAGRNNDETKFEGASLAVYDQLFREPFRHVVRLNGGKPPGRLVIVPDDAMHGLPFAALLNPDTRRYLVEEMPIEVAPSATLYVFSLMRREALASTPRSAVLVADPAFSTTIPLASQLDPLQGAREEVASIRRLYHPATVLQAREATSAALLRSAQDKDVVHFAGHSIVNEQQPWRSTLLFAPDGNDHGLLEAEDLLGRRLPRTRLVVLASCSSAGGAPVGAEGVAPFVRPLIATGVPAVIGTLWDVRDATVPDLSVSFHEDFRRSGDPAAALRNAQLAQIRSRGSIKFWAPFQLVGH